MFRFEGTAQLMNAVFTYESEFVSLSVLAKTPADAEIRANSLLREAPITYFWKITWTSVTELDPQLAGITNV